MPKTPEIEPELMQEAEAIWTPSPAAERPIAPEIACQVQEYLAKPYRMVVHGSPNSGYLAQAPELPNCVTAGATPEEALAMLRDAMEGWLLVSLEQGDPIPEPSSDASREYSGRFVMRLPKTLHRLLAERAEREGVSLNTLAIALLSQGLASVPYSDAGIASTDKSAAPAA